MKISTTITEAHFMKENYSDKSVSFLDDFRRKHRIETHNGQLLFDFHNTFCQLIAQILTEPLERVHASNWCDPYTSFLQLVTELDKSHVIHFHTLNYDLFMEHLACRAGIRGWMDDGFGDIGSAFFGRLYDKDESYTVRLQRFHQ